MNNPEDSFAWAYRLGCPPSTCNESTKKALSKGIVSLLWDNVADKIHPTSDVLEAKKNIFLYKLKEHSEDSAVQVIKRTSKLKAERYDLQKQILAAEVLRAKHEFSLRVKRQQLLKIKCARQALCAKKELFLIKRDQMQAQVQDCNQMLQVCCCLMPSVSDQIDQTTIDESLSLVGSMTSNRKQVWKKISDLLQPVATPALWNMLLQSRTSDTERVMQLGSEIPANINTNNYGEKLEIGVAKACSLHVTAVSKRLLHEARANARQRAIMEYIERIENSQINGLDISEWLELTLEVRKCEAEQICLQKEVKEITDTLEPRVQFNAELSTIATAIQGIDNQIVQCAEEIQTSIALLKGAGTALNSVEEKLLRGLQQFALLRSSDQDKNWLKVDLSIELDNFYDSIDVNALRKIILSGEFGAYRHAAYCISQSLYSISVPLDLDSVHDFPFIRAPLYHLLDCYKALMRSSWIANYKATCTNADSQLHLFDDINEQWSLMSTRNNIHTFPDLLDMIDQTCEKTKAELQHFDATFDAWKNQIVTDILMLDDRIVDGMTFKEWQQRFNIMSSVLASKTKALK